MRCGWYDENLLEALEFNHLDKDRKIGGISTMISNNIPINMIEMEIQKCELLCVNCHKSYTIEDNGYYIYKDKSRHECRQERIQILNK